MTKTPGLQLFVSVKWCLVYLNASWETWQTPLVWKWMFVITCDSILTAFYVSDMDSNVWKLDKDLRCASEYVCSNCFNMLLNCCSSVCDIGSYAWISSLSETVTDINTFCSLRFQVPWLFWHWLISPRSPCMFSPPWVWLGLICPRKIVSIIKACIIGFDFTSFFTWTVCNLIFHITGKIYWDILKRFTNQMLSILQVLRPSPQLSRQMRGLFHPLMNCVYFDTLSICHVDIIEFLFLGKMNPLRSPTDTIWLAHPVVNLF